MRLLLVLGSCSESRFVVGRLASFAEVAALSRCYVEQLKTPNPSEITEEFDLFSTGAFGPDSTSLHLRGGHRRSGRFHFHGLNVAPGRRARHQLAELFATSPDPNVPQPRTALVLPLATPLRHLAESIGHVLAKPADDRLNARQKEISTFLQQNDRRPRQTKHTTKQRKGK